MRRRTCEEMRMTQRHDDTMTGRHDGRTTGRQDDRMAGRDDQFFIHYISKQNLKVKPLSWSCEVELINNYYLIYHYVFI